MYRHSRLVRMGGLAAVVCLAAGCGVADYEKHMVEAQNRLARFEEESRLLDAPLAIPQREDKEKVQRPLANLFFRPPHGISTTPANENDPRLRLLYSYQPRDKASSAVKAVELAFGELPAAAGNHAGQQ